VAKQREMAREGASSSKGGTPARSSSRRGGEVLPRRRRRGARPTTLPREFPKGAQSFEGVLRTSSGATCRTARGALPLRVADGATYIDTTTMTVDEVVGEMLRRLPGTAVTKKVLIARSAGFCFGVKRAIAIADETAGKGGAGTGRKPRSSRSARSSQPADGARLQEKGVRVVETVEEISCGKVIIRSTG